MPPCCYAVFGGADIKKRGGHPRMERPMNCRELYTRERGRLKQEGPRSHAPRMPSHEETQIGPLHVRSRRNAGAATLALGDFASRGDSRRDRVVRWTTQAGAVIEVV